MARYQICPEKEMLVSTFCITIAGGGGNEASPMSSYMVLT